MAADGRGWTIFVQEKITMTEFQILGSESYARAQGCEDTRAKFSSECKKVKQI